MKIVITATSPNINAKVDPRFGRGANFIFVDPATLEWQAYENPAINASGGAGSQAAQLISTNGAQVVISGHFGPNAFQALQAADIKMYQFGDFQDVQDVIQAFNEGKLKEVKQAGRSHRRGR
jgi:predicted Fe-Mo cluster-binding NifX family protein